MLQKVLNKVLGLLKNKNLLRIVKQKLNSRRKKRECQKRKREKWKQQKIDNFIKREHLHQTIDRWLEDMKDTVQRGKLVSSKIF